MQPTQELIDAIYRDKVLRARSQTLEEKLMDGPRLFATAQEWSKAGIRAQNPGISEEEVLVILRQRIELKRRLEEAR